MELRSVSIRSESMEDTKIMVKEMRDDSPEVAKVLKYHRKPAKRAQEAHNPKKR